MELADVTRVLGKTGILIHCWQSQKTVQSYGKYFGIILLKKTLKYHTLQFRHLPDMHMPQIRQKKEKRVPCTYQILLSTQRAGNKVITIDCKIPK